MNLACEKAGRSSKCWMHHNVTQWDAFLLTYTRTTLRTACRGTCVDLEVWLNRIGEWEVLPDEVVRGLWDVKRSRSDRSLCGLLLKDVFQLDAEQYNEVWKSFDSDQVPGPNGIYKDCTRSNAYAIVVKLPEEIASDPRIQSEGVATLAAVALGGRAALSHCEKFFQGKKDLCSKSNRSDRSLRQRTSKPVSTDGGDENNRRLKAFLRAVLTALNVSLQAAQSEAQVRAQLEVDLAQAREELAKSRATVAALEHSLEHSLGQTSRNSQSPTRTQIDVMEALIRPQTTSEATQRSDERLKDITIPENHPAPTTNAGICSDPLENALAMLRLLRTV